MQLARFLNNVFKKDGFILIDANSKSYIIGNPKNENPLKLKMPELTTLNKNEMFDFNKQKENITNILNDIKR